MEIETNKMRNSRIVKELMFNLGIKSVQEFVNLLGVPYMQVYYAYNGTVNNMSQEMIDKIIETYPNVRERFLRYGEYPIFYEKENEARLQNQEQEAFPKPVTNAELFTMLERITTLFEKLQHHDQSILAREDNLRKREQHVIELEQRLISALERLENSNL